MRQGFRLLRACASAILRDPELAAIPVLVALPILATFLWAGGMAWLHSLELLPPALVIGLLLAGTLAGLAAWAFVPLLCQAACVAGVLQRFRGGDPTFRSALRDAWARRGPLARRLWSTPKGADPQVVYLVAEGRPRSDAQPPLGLADSQFRTLMLAVMLLSVAPGFILGGSALRLFQWIGDGLGVSEAWRTVLILSGITAMVAGILWGIGVAGLLSNVRHAAHYHHLKTGVDPLGLEPPGEPTA